MRKIPFLFLLLCAVVAYAQEKPLKPRPDAFPPILEASDSKAVTMAETIDEMADWDRYPTYETYIAMMQDWSERFPGLCTLDTIGTSVKGRLILCMVIRGEEAHKDSNPEFFYSSTMHGDEVTGFVMMLRLIDTLLNGYGYNQQYTDLVNSVDIYINPLSNPDGTYRGGNNSVSGAMRYNSNYVDLNRNYPDPFGTDPINAQQKENTAMIDYVGRHHFRLSANLHGGSEVMNYPWDSFTSSENPHPDRDWWIEVCKRFVDTSRTYSNSHFRDVNSQGYIEGGDWYVIPNGRQDYINYYHNCREMTMEISSDKTVSSNQLPEYWRFLQHSLVNYIAEIHTFAGDLDITDVEESQSAIRLYPNPTHDKVLLQGETDSDIVVFDIKGRELMRLPAGTQSIDIQHLPQGIYLLHTGTQSAKIVKR